jgi:signal transduction histidine kinase
LTSLVGNSDTDRGPGQNASIAEEDAELVFSLCHELGNMMGALRLHAHLLDDEMGPRGIARTSVDLDDLSARSAALLSLVRPLLTPAPSSAENMSVVGLVRNIEGLMAGHGSRGTALTFEVDEQIPSIRVDVGMLQRLIQSFLYFALESASRTGAVLLRAESRDDEVAILIEDNGPEGEDPAGFRDQMRRGRPLLCSVAESILKKQGGRFAAERDGTRTRISMMLPAIRLPAR